MLFNFSSNKNVQDDSSATKPSSAISDIQAGSPIYDVRTPEEYAQNHISGSINLPLGDIQNGKLPDSSKDSKIYLYCRSGNRSEQAKTILNQAGYSNVINLGSLEDVVSIGGTAAN